MSRESKLSPVVLLAYGVAYGAFGFAGNWLNVEFFFNVSFLFGSIFVMFSILRWGAKTGAIAGILAGSCSWILWNHPWAILIFTAEALFVGIVERRRRGCVVIPDLFFWIFVGAPMVWMFYHHVMGVAPQATLMITLKQGINGVFNALIANLAYLVWQAIVRRSGERAGLRQVLFIGVMSILMFPALALHVVTLRSQISEDESVLAQKARFAGDQARTLFEHWFDDHMKDVRGLANMIGDPDHVAPAEAQRILESVKTVSAEFVRMGVFDRHGIVRAYNPPVDELGRSAIGRDFSDRPFLPELRRRGTAYVSDIMMGRMGNPAPIAVILAPILIADEFHGFCSGVIDVHQLSKLLDDLLNGDRIDMTLVDREGRVVASSRPDTRIMESFQRPASGATTRVNAHVRQWVPAPEPGTSIMQRWRRSVFFTESQMRPDIGWRIVTDVSLAPMFDKLSETTIRHFAALFALLLVAVAMSHLLSGGVVGTLTRLQASTSRLPERVQAGQPIDDLPVSHVEELDGLIGNFRRMGEALRAAFEGQRRLNVALERNLHEKEMMVKDLHDGIGGIVSNIVMVGEYGLTRVDNPECRDQLRKMVDLASEGVTEVRSFMNSTVVGDLAWHDLLAEIKGHGARMLDPHGIRFQVSSDIASGVASMGPYQYLNIARIAREAITNCLKHASATRVDLEFRVNRDRFDLVIRDNGVGFDAGSVRRRGIANMFVRAHNIGASLSVTGEGGTCVALSLSSRTPEVG